MGKTIVSHPPVINILMAAMFSNSFPEKWWVPTNFTAQPWTSTAGLQRYKTVSRVADNGNTRGLWHDVTLGHAGQRLVAQGQPGAATRQRLGWRLMELL